LISTRRSVSREGLLDDVTLETLYLGDLVPGSPLWSRGNMEMDFVRP
jgi:hypothetical protein